MKKYSSNPTWQLSVKIMRVSAPLALVASLIVAAFAYQEERYIFFTIDCICIATNAFLTYVEWRVFTLTGEI